MSIAITPTSEDLNDANYYADERKKITQWNRFKKAKPHLFSYTWIEIRLNRQLAAKNPEYWDNLIATDIRARRTFCTKLHCNIHYPRGQDCGERDHLQIFNSSDSVLTACETACRETFKHYQIGDTPMPSANITQWVNEGGGICLKYDAALYAMGIDDNRRTDKHITPHVDTIGTGFDVKLHDARGNDVYRDMYNNIAPNFKINQYYCQDLALQLFGEKCDLTTGEKILGFFIGETIVHLALWFGQKTIYGKTLTSINKPAVKVPTAKQVHKIREEDQRYFDVDNSAFCISDHITLSQLGITPATNHLTFSTEFANTGHLIEPLYVYTKSSNQLLEKPNKEININNYKSHMQRSRLTPEVIAKLPYPLKQIDYWAYSNDDATNLPRHLQRNLLGKRLTNEYDVLRTRVPRIDVHDLADSYEALYTDMHATCLRVVNQLVTDITLQILAEKMILYFLRTTVPGLIRAVAVAEIKVTQMILRYCASRLLTLTIVKLGASLITKVLARVAALASIPYVGVVLFLIALLDVALSFVDVLKVQNMTTQAGIDGYALLQIENNRQLYGYGTWEYSPSFLMDVYDQCTYRPGHSSGTPSDMEEAAIAAARRVFDRHRQPGSSTIANETARSGDEAPSPTITAPPASIGIQLEDVFNTKMEVDMQHMMFASMYIRDLKYNSNGSTIDQGHHNNKTLDEQELNSFALYLEQKNSQLTETVISQKLDTYMSEFMARMNTHNYCTYMLYGYIVLLFPVIAGYIGDQQHPGVKSTLLLIALLLFGLITFSFYAAQLFQPIEKNILVYFSNRKSPFAIINQLRDYLKKHE